MTLSDDEETPTAGTELGKRKIREVEFPKPRPSSSRYFATPSAFATFGDVKAFTLDKFGALRDNTEDGSRPHVYRRRVQTITDSSTGSFTPGRVEGDNKEEGHDADANDTSSTWSQYIDTDWKIEGTSNPGGSDPSSHSSVPISCTLHERTAASGGPSLQQQQSPLQQAVEDSSHGEFELEFPQTAVAGVGVVAAASELRNDSPDPEVNAAAGSLPPALSRQSIDHCHRTTTTTTTTVLRFVDRRSDLASAGASGRSASRSPQDNDDLLPRLMSCNMRSSSSEGARLPRQSTDQYPVRIEYRFASERLETSLLQRMEARQRLQDESAGEERVCGHVISPEDLIWGSVKHYCGMVLDRETRALLGTAILFMPPDQSWEQQQQATSSTSATQPQPQQLHGGSGGGGSGVSKAAWVTCVKVVEGRTEVLIKTSKGALHVAQLLLTSTTLGLALFSVHVWQATFALAFLSRVAGPARLPHRLFVDVDRSDRVYVTAYEEPWEFEAGTIADVRVRPGRIVDAGRHEIVEIDFTAGRLGGSITSPAGFRGGLVVRADGLLAGIVTGEVLGRHPTNIDFSSAFNVYSLLEEL